MRIAATGTTTAGGPADKRNLGSPSVLVSLSSASVQRQGHSAQEPRQTGPSASSQSSEQPPGPEAEAEREPQTRADPGAAHALPLALCFYAYAVGR